MAMLRPNKWMCGCELAHADGAFAVRVSIGSPAMKIYRPISSGKQPSQVWTRQAVEAAADEAADLFGPARYFLVY